jgi:hypothetical protein
MPPVPGRKRQGIQKKILIKDHPGRSVTPVYAVMLN